MSCVWDDAGNVKGNWKVESPAAAVESCGGCTGPYEGSSGMAAGPELLPNCWYPFVRGRKDGSWGIANRVSMEDGENG